MNCQQTNTNEIDCVTDVLERVASVSGAQTDSAIARVLGVNRSTVSNCRARGNTPYETLVRFALREGLSIDWLLTGRGARRVVGEHDNETGSVYERDIGAMLKQALDISEELGVSRQMTAHQLQAVLGFASEYQPSRERLADFVSAACGVAGIKTRGLNDE